MRGPIKILFNNPCKFENVLTKCCDNNILEVLGIVESMLNKDGNSKKRKVSNA